MRQVKGTLRRASPSLDSHINDSNFTKRKNTQKLKKNRAKRTFLFSVDMKQKILILHADTNNIRILLTSHGGSYHHALKFLKVRYIFLEISFFMLIWRSIHSAHSSLSTKNPLNKSFGFNPFRTSLFKISARLFWS